MKEYADQTVLFLIQDLLQKQEPQFIPHYEGYHPSKSDIYQPLVDTPHGCYIILDWICYFFALVLTFQMVCTLHFVSEVAEAYNSRTQAGKDKICKVMQNQNLILNHCSCYDQTIC